MNRILVDEIIPRKIPSEFQLTMKRSTHTTKKDGRKITTQEMKPVCQITCQRCVTLSLNFRDDADGSRDPQQKSASESERMTIKDQILLTVDLHTNAVCPIK